MYSVTFKRTIDGAEISFGPNSNAIVDMDLSNGVSVDLGISQGIGQVGETVETKRIGGRNIAVHGCVFKDVEATKNLIRKIFTPFAEGNLYFEKKYMARVHVRSTPTFEMTGGKFSMQLFSPSPYFFARSLVTEVVKDKATINNSGDVSVPFEVSIESPKGSIADVVLSDGEDFLKINGTVEPNQKIRIFRSNDGILKAEMTDSKGTTDIISRIDEKSRLFEMKAGSNNLSLTYKNINAPALSASAIVSFNTAVVNIYEN